MSRAEAIPTLVSSKGSRENAKSTKNENSQLTLISLTAYLIHDAKSCEIFELVCGLWSQHTNLMEVHTMSQSHCPVTQHLSV